MRVIFIILVALVMVPFVSVKAIYNPTNVPNNKYGIHVADINDLADVPALVNSSGGLWGYVTFVMADNDRDLGKWQTVFHQLERLQLIPIVRLATHMQKGSWVIPQAVDIDQTVNFLSDLSWPTKNRYVVLFNEPNHAKEWGNTIDPEGYALISHQFASKLHNRSNDYFVLPAGFDASAPNGVDTLDESQYLARMFASVPSLTADFDGWTSHSYPNPGFTGSPNDTGRGSIRTYQWELSELSSIGVSKDLPVFITETGWAHNGGRSSQGQLSPDVVAEYMTLAAQTVWNDPRIVAVTPFLFQYQDPLFAMFSWLMPKERRPYAFYDRYAALPKITGKPLFSPSSDYLALLRKPLTL